MSTVPDALSREPDLGDGSLTHSRAGVPQGHAPPEQPFTGRLRPLDRVVTVREDTVVLVFTGAARPVLRQPGEKLMPGWNPFRRVTAVLPVTTAVVPLSVRISGLVTFDSATVESVTLKVPVQLCDAGGFEVAAELAATYGPGFGSHLMTELQRAIETGVRAAFRMNAVADLQRSGLAQILDDRWLPDTFAAGAVVRRGLSVVDVAWPTEVSPTSPARLPPPVAAAIPAALELSLDARLRRVWQAGSAVPVRGIAGAQVSGEATVVVVCDIPPDAYETSRLQESFAELYGDRSLVLAVLTGGGYPELVSSWLRQVDAGHVVVLGVDVLRNGDLLRVRLDGALAPGRGRRGQPSQAGSEVAALRQLLPHRQVELTAVPVPS